MIIVAGWARTGTSIMVKCLEKSGYNLGPEKHLTGAQYKTENNQFRVCNFLIMYYSGFKSISKQQYNEQIYTDDFFVGIPENGKKIPFGVKQQMRRFVNYAKSNNIEVLKDPQSAFAMQEWMEFDQIFQNAKFIWMKRDPIEAAKSFIRLKIPRIPQYRGVLTTTKALKTLKLHDQMWGKILKNKEHHIVWLEDLLNFPKITQELLSQFLGRKFDISMIDASMTYDGGNRFELKAEPLRPEDLKPVEYN